MKVFVFVAFALIGCTFAMPQWDLDIGGHLQAAGGFATGVVAVPVLGLGGK